MSSMMITQAAHCKSNLIPERALQVLQEEKDITLRKTFSVLNSYKWFLTVQSQKVSLKHLEVGER